MKWEKVRAEYPDKWIVYDILKESQQNNSVIVTDIAIIDTFNTLNDAYKYYCKLHKEDKNRKVTIGDTRKSKLIYNIKRFGILKGCSYNG